MSIAGNNHSCIPLRALRIAASDILRRSCAVSLASTSFSATCQEDAESLDAIMEIIMQRKNSDRLGRYWSDGNELRRTIQYLGLDWEMYQGLRLRNAFAWGDIGDCRETRIYECNNQLKLGCLPNLRSADFKRPNRTVDWRAYEQNTAKNLMQISEAFIWSLHGRRKYAALTRHLEQDRIASEFCGLLDARRK